MSVRREFVLQVEESGGVAIDQFVEVTNALTGMPPGRVRVTIEALDEPDGDRT